MSLEDKYQALQECLRDMGSVAVAYSGGVDSALLARIAQDILGKHALAVTARSPSLPQSELDAAITLARAIGIRHRVIDTHEMDDPEYVANRGDRCFFCKKELFTQLVPIAKEEGVRHLALGTITDDLGEHRPGHEAARLFSVRSPLLESGFSKADVRQLSRKLRLPTWEKPATACLASRVAYGVQVTPEVLGKIERGEALLRQLGCTQVRLRHEGRTARLEVHPDSMAHLVEHRETVVSVLKDEGYAFVTLDLEGYRSGSFNVLLEKDPTP